VLGVFLLQAGKIVGGIRISREAGTTVLTASYLPGDNQAICKYMSPRKVALVDAGVRMSEDERTAYIFLPGTPPHKLTGVSSFYVLNNLLLVFGKSKWRAAWLSL
jgi:hypothetical protein